MYLECFSESYQKRWLNQFIMKLLKLTISRINIITEMMFTHHCFDKNASGQIQISQYININKKYQKSSLFYICGEIIILFGRLLYFKFLFRNIVQRGIWNIYNHF